MSRCNVEALEGAVLLQDYVFYGPVRYDQHAGVLYRRWHFDSVWRRLLLKS